ncbi:RHS repeat-associated core domain-containing protein [Micromonospora sp. NPDC003241]
MLAPTATRVAADTPDGSILMGARLYNPTYGRFRSVDQIFGGWNANSYEYCVGDPVNCADMKCKAGRYPNWSCNFAAKWGHVEPQSLRWYSSASALASEILAIIAGLIGKGPGLVIGLLIWALGKAHIWIKSRILKNHCVTHSGAFGINLFIHGAGVTVNLQMQIRGAADADSTKGDRLGPTGPRASLVRRIGFHTGSR